MLQTAIETQTEHIAFQSLTEIAVIELNEGNAERTLELVTSCQQHPSTKREVFNRAESLRAEWVAQLTPEQVEVAEARTQARTLEDLAKEILTAG